MKRECSNKHLSILASLQPPPVAHLEFNVQETCVCFADWSILYVVIGVFLGFLSISGCCWGLTCMCRRSRKPRTRTKPQKYALLGTQDDEIPACKYYCNLDEAGFFFVKLTSKPTILLSDTEYISIGLRDRFGCIVRKSVQIQWYFTLKWFG